MNMLKHNTMVRKRLYKLLIRCTILLSVGVLYYIFIRVTGIKIPCLFYEITGMSCPGCGVTRMALALFQLDIAEAFKYQPVVLCSILPFGICLGVYAMRYVKDGNRQFSKWQSAVMWIIIAALLLFCIYRNVITLLN